MEIKTEVELISCGDGQRWKGEWWRQEEGEGCSEQPRHILRSYAITSARIAIARCQEGQAEQYLHVDFRRAKARGGRRRLVSYRNGHLASIRETD